MIKNISATLLICFISIYACFSQVIALTGNVTDKKTGITLPGVTVRTGNYGTSTDANGNFELVVQQSILQQNGITVSSIGYQQQHLDFEGTNYHIVLVSAANHLAEVVISDKGESIVAKAIRRIPENYPARGFMMTGLLQMVNTSKDTLGWHYFYHNNADVQLYYPGYLNKNKIPQIRLLHKTDTLIDDLKEGPIKWVNGYTTVTHHDFVLNRLEVLNPDHLNRYTFVLNGKDWVNNNKVYVVNFFSKADEKNAGTLYIDTVTYAFTRVVFTKYHIKHAAGIETDKSSSLIDYRSINGKWFLEAIDINNISHHNKLQLYRATNFKTIGIDTVRVNPLAYSDEIPEFSEDIKIKSLSTELIHADTITNLAPDSLFTRTSIPFINMAGKKDKGSLIYTAYVDYMVNNNIREILAIGKLPLSLNGYQPLLSKNTSPVSVYVFCLNTQFRLYNHFFAQLDIQFNAGIGGTKNKERAYGLFYSFEFNQKAHLIGLSPFFGYSKIELSPNNIVYYAQNSWVTGLNITYDITHRLGLFSAVKYYSPYYVVNTNMLLVNPRPLTFNAGLIFKVKL